MAADAARALRLTGDIEALARAFTGPDVQAQALVALAQKLDTDDRLRGRLLADAVVLSVEWHVVFPAVPRSVQFAIVDDLTSGAPGA